jgi:hypothetical protein
MAAISQQQHHQPMAQLPPPTTTTVSATVGKASAGSKAQGKANEKEKTAANRLVSNNAAAALSARIANNKERYTCKFCSKVFPRSANLTRHVSFGKEGNQTVDKK